MSPGLDEPLGWLLGALLTLCFFVCFVVGPGGFREGTGSPRNPGRWPWGGLPGIPGALGPRPNGALFKAAEL